MGYILNADLSQSLKSSSEQFIIEVRFPQGHREHSSWKYMNATILTICNLANCSEDPWCLMKDYIREQWIGGGALSYLNKCVFGCNKSYIVMRSVHYVFTNTCSHAVDNLWTVRWAFIDLTAGPFTWGPTVGGEGVRVEHSLPSVDISFGSHSGSLMILKNFSTYLELHSHCRV